MLVLAQQPCPLRAQPLSRGTQQGPPPPHSLSCSAFSLRLASLFVCVTRLSGIVVRLSGIDAARRSAPVGSPLSLLPAPL